MALRQAQIELTIELFLRAFTSEKDKDARYKMLIQLEDAFDGSIENWKNRIEDQLYDETLKEELRNVFERKAHREYKDLCVIEALNGEHKREIRYLGAKKLDMLGWSGKLEDSYGDFVDSGFSFVVKQENVVVGFALAYKCPTYGGC